MPSLAHIALESVPGQERRRCQAEETPHISAQVDQRPLCKAGLKGCMASFYQAGNSILIR